MKALTFHAPGDVRYEDVPEPDMRSKSDVIVRVERTAICGSDLHVVRGHEQGLDPGTILGHEFLGEVVAVGSEVKSVRVGARVVSPFSTSCGRCYFCTRGLHSRCEKGEVFGWVEAGAGLQGAQAEYVRVPQADGTLVAVPDEAPVELALLAGDVFATGMFCADLGAIQAGDTVCVLGLGPVGLSACLAAVEQRAQPVVAIDSVPERLELARGLGAVPLPLATTAELRAHVDGLTEGRGADVVLELVGHPEASRLAADLVRTGGTIAAAGVHNEARFAFSPKEAYDKNLTYRAGRCPARAYAERALGWVATRAVQLEPMLSHLLPLEEGVRGYTLFDQKLEGCTKVVLDPRPR